MTKLLVLLYLTGLFSVGSPNSKSIKIEDRYKVEGTVSGEISANETFHLILAKNKESKLYEIIPLVYDNQDFKRLESIDFENFPSVLSFHVSGEILTLAVSSEKEDGVLKVLDVDLKSGKTVSSENIAISGFKTSVKSSAESVLLFADKDSFKVLTISNAKTNKVTSVLKNDANKDLLKLLEGESIENVDTNEFVSNGSINNLRAYLEGETLLITQQDDKGDATNLFSLDKSKGDQAQFSQKKFNHPDGYKRTTSFLKNGNLFRFSLNKSNAVIAFNSLDGSVSKELNVSDDLVGKSSKYFYDMQSFLKDAAKSSNAPTITVNKSTNDNFVVRADYVSVKEYRYYNWWWFHIHMRNQMIMQQQMQIQQHQIKTFGPSENIFNEWLLFPVLEKHYFEFVVNSGFEVTNDESGFKKREIDYQTLIENMNHTKKLSDFSSVFLSTEFRFFGFDKKDNSFKVFTKEYR